MYHIRTVDISELESFKGMTFNAFQHYVQNSLSDLDLILLGAELFDQPIGLLTGSVQQKTVLIHSIFVAYRYRNIGVGTALMHQMEMEARRRGLKQIRTNLPEGSSGHVFLAHMNRLHPKETTFEPSGIRFKAKFTHIADADWVRRSSLPSSFRPYLWRQAPTAMLEQIRAGRGSWVPDWADPFAYESILQPDTSWILSHGDRPIGWLIFHESKENPRDLECPVLFTHPSYAARGRALHLVAESFRIVHRLGYQHGIFDVRADNSHMLRFTSNRLGPYITEKGVSLEYIQAI